MAGDGKDRASGSPRNKEELRKDTRTHALPSDCFHSEDLLSPAQYPDDELKAAFRDTSQAIARLFNLLVGFSLFSILALMTPDVALLDANSSLTVPMAGSVAFKTFIFLGPLLLVGIRVFLYAYVAHYLKLDLVRQRRGINAPVEIALLRHPLLRRVTVPLLYGLTPALLMLFAWKGSAIPKLANVLWLLLVITTTLHIYVYIARHPIPHFPRPIVNLSLGVLLLSLSVWVVVQDESLHRTLELSRADLSNDSFIQGNFKRANLKAANMMETELASANLIGADLTEAILRDAMLNNADLRRAVLYNANLERASLSGAKLEGADLHSSNLRGSNMQDARLINANLMQADLRGADLQRANLKGARLFLSDLGQADLRHAVNVRCSQLVEAAEWHTAYRSQELACGSPIVLPDEPEEDLSSEISLR